MTIIEISMTGQKSRNENSQSSKNNLLTDERKSITILGDSLLNEINEKGLSHRNRWLINLEQPVKQFLMKLMT